MPSAREPESQNFYRRIIELLNGARIPFLVGGAFAHEYHTGITRDTKDLDIFIYRRHLESILDLLSASGYPTELTFSHWLAKTYHRDVFVDIIFSSGNGLCEVDSLWFQNSTEGEVFGLPVRYCSPEEMIWSKAFIMERERYDGADIAHLLLACGRHIDWERLLDRFGPHWRVLLSHLILFGYIYPSEHLHVPQPVLRELIRRLEEEMDRGGPTERLCQGSLLSRIQYLDDIQQGGYNDARLAPEGRMTPAETEQWTAAGQVEKVKNK